MLSATSFALDWGELAPLRLRARGVAEGLYAGAHRSLRRGAGVEFGGHRPYVPGDDLRFFDHRALLRYDRLMVRQFETETERALWLCLDATASMGYRGSGLGAKLAYGALMAAALARIAMATGDPVGLLWLGGGSQHAVLSSGGREGYERILSALEAAEAGGDLADEGRSVDFALAPIQRRPRRGSVTVLLTDLLDFPERSRGALLELTTRGRKLVVVQILDPREARFDFPSHVRLKAVEGDGVVEADPSVVRADYLAALHALQQDWDRELRGRGGELVVAITDEPPAHAAARILRAVLGGGA